MRQQTTDTVSLTIAFEHLTDDDLRSIESHSNKSVYRYACGCKVVRCFDSSNGSVRWCGAHSPRPTRLRNRRNDASRIPKRGFR